MLKCVFDFRAACTFARHFYVISYPIICLKSWPWMSMTKLIGVKMKPVSGLITALELSHLHRAVVLRWFSEFFDH